MKTLLMLLLSCAMISCAKSGGGGGKGGGDSFNGPEDINSPEAQALLAGLLCSQVPLETDEGEELAVAELNFVEDGSLPTNLYFHGGGADDYDRGDFLALLEGRWSLSGAKLTLSFPEGEDSIVYVEPVSGGVLFHEKADFSGQVEFLGYCD